MIWSVLFCISFLSFTTVSALTEPELLARLEGLSARIKVRVVLFVFEECSEELLAPAILCCKESARSKQERPVGWVFWVPKPLVRGFGCPSWFFVA